MTGTLINIGTVLAGTLIGISVGSRLPEGMRQRVLAGLGMVTLVIGVDLALASRRRSTGRCQIPCRPGRLPAAGASKRIAPGAGASSAAVVEE